MESDPVIYIEGKARLVYIDAAKCLALLAMVVGHTAWWPAVEVMDNMRLPMFWLAAGFTASVNFSLRKRARALLRPYLWMTAICLAFTLVITGSIPLDSIWGIAYARYQLFANPAPAGETLPLMQLNNSVLWFLPSLFSAYLLYKFLRKIRCVLWQGIACAASLGVAWAFDLLPVLLPWSLDVAFYIAPYMWFGRLVRDRGWLDLGPRILLVGGTLLYTVLFHFCGPVNISLREYGALGPFGDFACGSAGAVVVIILLRWASRWKVSAWGARLLARLELESLYIFGLQLVFMGAVVALGYKFGWRFLTPLSLIAAVVGGYATGRAIRKLKRITPLSHKKY